MQASRRREVWGWALGALVACASCTNEREPSLKIRVRTTANQAVEAFQATLAFADGGVTSLACPGSNEDAAGLRCSEDGLDVLGSERPIAVTLRSRGNTF